MDIYVSSGAFGEATLPGMLERAAEWGVRRIELTAGMAPVADPLAALGSAGDIAFLIHNYFPPPAEPFVLNLASEDPETLARSRGHCRAAIRLSAALGAPAYSVHAGFAADVRPEHLGRRIPADRMTDRGRAAGIFAESVRELLDHAQAAGVRLCIENNVVSAPNLVGGENAMLLLATAPELTAFAAEIASPWLGLLIDVGHVKVTCRTLGLDPRRFLADVAPHTSILHLSDNDGRADTNGAFGPEAWFMPELHRFDCDIAVIEAYNLSRASLDACSAAIGAMHDLD